MRDSDQYPARFEFLYDPGLVMRFSEDYGPRLDYRRGRSVTVLPPLCSLRRRCRGSPARLREVSIVRNVAMAGGTERVESVLGRIARHGIKVERHASEELRAAGEGTVALYVRREGEPGRLLVDEHSEYGDVLHELRHFHQDRVAGHPGGYDVGEIEADEVDAYAYEVRAGPLLDYTIEEMEESVAQLESAIEVHGYLEPE